MGPLRSRLDGARRAVARLPLRPLRVEPLPSGLPSVLITGAGGRIGRILRAGLAGDFALRGIDSRPGPGVDLVADMRSLRRVEPAFVGIDAVVDLAAKPRADAPWQSIYENNLPATVNALEAARRAGVRRFVFASSNHVTGLYHSEEPYASIMAGNYDGLSAAEVDLLRAADAEIRPDGFYAVGKAACEAAARFYSEQHGLRVICLRLGQINIDDRPKEPAHFATILFQRDLVQLVRRCLQAPPGVRFGVFYGVSANTWRIWDIEDARDALGYEPEGNAEEFRGSV